SGAGVAVEVVELPEAQRLNAGYISRLTRGRPLVRLKVAASLDGRTAMASGESQWITGAQARADVQRWRARSCAVITGSGTVLVDDPRLTVRDSALAVAGRIRQPLRVVCDGRGQIKADRALTSGAADAGLTGTAPALLVRAVPVTVVGSAEVIQLPAGDDGTGVSLPALLELLAQRQCNEVLVEAGPKLIGAFLASGLWDELLLYQAPRLLGSDARSLAALPFTRMAEAIGATIADCTQIGADLRLRLRPAGHD
ncbi:MAG: bifunctional diaminohydroxyphosphoribosylaminopyrimidine deaminase/5-amino-6-(5-phosphoribosylamino)uracil reductase RibD, partial [Pseudomonadales bacterium]|nr:bifunctional diaminohydroxyphosphoribosylaminopyrimidine deaminase/5-amino-6-(5-phosphoribosylamino)uracil reductase RibD [Pseudomonadales bacterium]